MPSARRSARGWSDDGLHAREESRKIASTTPGGTISMKSRLALVTVAAVCAAQFLWASPEATAQPAQSGQYGTVRFPVSCKPGVQEQFERAVAMLHSFFYPET